MVVEEDHEGMEDDRKEMVDGHKESVVAAEVTSSLVLSCNLEGLEALVALVDLEALEAQACRLQLHLLRFNWQQQRPRLHLPWEQLPTLQSQALGLPLMPSLLTFQRIQFENR